MEISGDAYLYLRKSSYRGKQKARGRSVRQQRAVGVTWCEEQGISVAEEYLDDDRSASRMGAKPREEFERMLADIESGRIRSGDVVVAWESSRLHRDLAVYVQLRDACWKADVLWCINGRLYDLSKREDRKASAYDAIQDEDAAYETSERVRRDMRMNAADGRPHARSPYGYRRIYDSGTGELERVVVVEEQAEVLRELYRRVRGLESLRSIMKDLNGRGIPSAGGKTWGHPAQITQLLMNPAYLGKRTHLGEVVSDGIWPPILALPDGAADEETFYAVKTILTDPARRTVRDGAVRHLLTNVARCGKCDAAVWATYHGRGYRRYYCHDGCFSRKADPVDDYVVSLVVARFARPDAAKLYEVDRVGGSDKVLLGQIGRWRDELGEGERLVESGELTMARLAKVEQRLLPKIDEAERKLGAMRVDPLLRQLIRPSAALVHQAWKALKVEQQRAVVKAATVHVRIVPAGRGQRFLPPEEYMDVKWRKRT